MDRLQAMHLFVRVAELSSFSAVAQQLGMARSVVTRQIAALETHLGVKLMARSTRKLTLTSAGAAYLEKCRVILNLEGSSIWSNHEDRRIAKLDCVPLRMRGIAVRGVRVSLFTISASAWRIFAASVAKAWRLHRYNQLALLLLQLAPIFVDISPNVVFVQRND